jgi:hypothetical protein
MRASVPPRHADSWSGYGGADAYAAAVQTHGLVRALKLAVAAAAAATAAAAAAVAAAAVAHGPEAATEPTELAAAALAAVATSAARHVGDLGAAAVHAVLGRLQEGASCGERASHLLR